MEVTSLWWWQSYHTAADQYYEGLERTHTRGRTLDDHNSCAVYQVAGKFQQLLSYHTTSIAAAPNRASVTQNKKHNKRTITTTTVKILMRLRLQRTAAAAAVVTARAPWQQASERRTRKEKTAKYVRMESKGRNKNT